MTYFLDSCTLISIFEGRSQKAANKLKMALRDNIKIPSLVKGELITGAYKCHNVERKMDTITKILEPYETVPFDEEASEVYGRMRAELEMKGNVIGPDDMIIAATVLSRGGIFVTSNTREFSRVKGLQIEDWCK